MGDTAYGRRWSATVILIVINAVFFALQLVMGMMERTLIARVFAYLPLYPGDLAHGFIWQLLTFQFLHGGFLHLLLNCVMLYLFGRNLEATLGVRRFLGLYFGSGAFGGLLQAICSWVLPSHFGMGPVVGASAGVFGLVAAFAFLNRETTITALVLFIIPVSMRAKYLLIVEFIIALLGMLDRSSNIAHAAHLGGMLAALAYLQGMRWLPSRTFRFPWRRLRPVPRPRELVVTPAAAGRASRRQAGPPTPPAPSPSPAAPAAPDFISREVDPILDKISAQGMQSLTERERKILELARARMNKR